MRPKSRKTTNTANRAPPQAVKSILVWKAKAVRASTTAAVTPTAIRTSDTSYMEQTEPMSHPSAKVNIPRKMKLCGLFLRTDGTQAKVMIIPKETITARIMIQLFSLAYTPTSGMKKNPMNAMVMVS